MIRSITPLLYFFRGEDQEILGDSDVPQKPPQFYSLNSTAAFGTKGAVLYHDEVEVRIGSSCTAYMRAKQNDHPGMHGGNYFFRYVLK